MGLPLADADQACCQLTHGNYPCQPEVCLLGKILPTIRKTLLQIMYPSKIPLGCFAFLGE